MGRRIDYDFLIDRQRLGLQRFPVVTDIDAESKVTGHSLAKSRVEDRLALLDTGSGSTWLPRSWLKALAVYGQPQKVEQNRDVNTILGPSQELIGIWNVSLSLNGVEISNSLPVRCPLSPNSTGLTFAVIGQDILGEFAMYHNAGQNRAWLKEVPTRPAARLLWRLLDL